jgi:undecaprenyl diphosphate synthase
MVRAVQQIAAQCREGALDPLEVDETTISSALYTSGQPDPDLLIRTGGERRLSNFLLWQASYAELYFTSTMWPDFRRDQFLEALSSFSDRQRRFGKTGAQLREE